MMSNPATQSRTASPSQAGGQARSPRKAIQAAIGAIARANPSQKWARLVNRLANE